MKQYCPSVHTGAVIIDRISYIFFSNLPRNAISIMSKITA